MSVLSTFSRIQIAGLTGGVWSRGVDINALSAIPSGTTHAIVQFESNSTGSTWGVGNFEEVSTFTSGTVNRGDQVKFIPLGVSQDLDFYLGSTANGKWFLLGYTDHINAITPVDKYASVTGTGTYTIDCSGDLPSGAINGWALIDISKLAKIGAVGATSAQYKSMASNKDRIHVIAPLNASRQFEISGSAAMTAGQLRILGWMDAAAYQGSSDPSTNRYAHGGAAGWEELGYTSATAFDHWRISNASTTSASPSAQIAETRPSGDTSFSRTDINGEIGHRFVVPNGSGKIEAYSAVAGVYYTWYGGFVADTAAPLIISVDTFVAGATATVVFDKSVSSITRIRVGNVIPDETTIAYHYIDITSFSGSGTTWTFTVPNLVDSTDGIRLGGVILTPTTNGGNGADFTGLTYSKTDYASVNIEDVLEGNVCEGDTPELISNDQIAYDSTTAGSVDVHGIYSDPNDPPFIGTQTMWHYAADFKWYSFEITTESGGGATGGLTSVGLTSVGLTNAGLTITGL